MFRRLLTVLALLGAAFMVAPQVVSAESGGGIAGSTQEAMGRLAGGGLTNCAIISGDGQVACWGDNQKGQLGLGDTTHRALATTIPGLNATQIAESNGLKTSAFTTCALLTDTSVKCWGYNVYGNLGIGNQTDSLTPVNVCAVDGCGNGILTGVKAISLGFGFGCAILSDDRVACWGYNTGWQLGLDPSGGNWAKFYPVVVSGVAHAVQISSGFGHTCAVINDGSLKCWGNGNDGQLGLGDGNNTSRGANTVTAAGISNVKAVSGMMSATCAIVGTSNDLKCWGKNYNLDSSQTDSIHNTPEQLLTGAKAIDTGTYGGCAIKNSGQLTCWGSLSQLGAGPAPTNMVSANSVNDVPGMTSVTNVAVGSNSVCVTQAGALKCWGSADEPVLGNNELTPTRLTSGTAANVLVPNDQTASVNSIADKTTASGAVALVGTSTSGQVLTYVSNAPSVCTVANDSTTWTVTPVGPGVCSVTGTADGGSYLGSYYNSASGTVTFAVSAVAPVVVLDAASSITISSATLSASVNPAQLSTTSVLKYSTSSDLTGATSVALTALAASGSATSLSKSLTGLPSGTTYYYTVISTNSVGTTTAPIRSFSTVGYPPVVVTGSPTSVSSGRATLNAVVTPGGVTTTIWFTIGQKSDLSDGKKIEYRDLSDLTAVDVSVTATDLIESARYYFRIEASNFLGSAKGDIKSFTAARPVGITVNNAAEFTNKKTVTIYATGPSGSTQVILSNDGGFGSAQTFSLTDSYAEIPWTLVASRDERLPKTVYARFVQRFGTQSSTNTDDIILDTTAPEMNSASGSSTGSSSDNVSVQGIHVSAAKGGVKLTVKAKDANSGIGTVQVKGSSGGSPVDVTTGSPKATSRTIKVNTTKKKLWVRVVDRAGNVSKWVTVTVK